MYNIRACFFRASFLLGRLVIVPFNFAFGSYLVFHYKRTEVRREIGVEPTDVVEGVNFELSLLALIFVLLLFLRQLFLQLLHLYLQLSHFDLMSEVGHQLVLHLLLFLFILAHNRLIVLLHFTYRFFLTFFEHLTVVQLLGGII